MKIVIGLVMFLAVVFLLLFLGGLASAFFEARRETRAGLPVSRPAKELKIKRQARGDGVGGSLLIWWRGVRTGIPQCWCGRGTILFYPGIGSLGHSWESFDGYGCMACENGDPLAWSIHEKAGGYARSATAMVGGRVPVRHES